MATEYLSLLSALPTKKEEQVETSVTGTALVDLHNTTGCPKQLASGWIYGLPDIKGQIPNHFYTDVGFNYGRAGGSQLPKSIGWTGGIADYKTRFSSMLSNYETTREYGGKFICLISALWGADGSQPPDAPYPGDDNDWTSWDNLLTQWVADVEGAGMLEGLILDIWNEPDLKFFWNRPMKQWLDMWSRTYHKLRIELPSLRFSGPCLSAAPSASNQWWTEFLDRVVNDKSAPDQWSWHMEQGPDERTNMPSSVTEFRELLEKASLSEDVEININEYGTWSEQVPSGAAWWIAQLERENCIGMRGNWAMAGALHDLLAGLLSKPGAGTDQYQIESGDYYPTAEFHVYKYYAQEMKGERNRTTPTADMLGDVYAVADGTTLRILAGTRIATGKWTVKVSGLENLGIGDGTTVVVRRLLFKGSEDHFARCDGPKDMGISEMVVTGGCLSIEVDQDDTLSAFVYEIKASQ